MDDVASPASGALVSGAATVTFAGRYNYVEVYNTANGTSADTGVWYVTTDGSTPALGNGYLVGPGERAIVPNDAPFWWQGYNYGTGPTQPSPAANPGTNVQIASASNTDASDYQVTGV